MTDQLSNRSFKCKLCSMVCCCVASAIYAYPTMIFYDPAFTILLPSFLTGYIIVNLAEMIVIALDQPHLFFEMTFAIIGFISSLCCSMYQLHKWIKWVIETRNEENNAVVLGWQEFLLGLACLLNAVVLLIDLLFYVYGMFYYTSNNGE